MKTRNYLANLSFEEIIYFLTEAMGIMEMINDFFFLLCSQYYKKRGKVATNNEYINSS